MVTMMMRTNDVTRGESRKMMRLPEKVSYLLQGARIYLDPTIPTICTVPFKMKQNQNGIYMNQRLHQINGVIAEPQMNRILLLRLLDAIQFDRPKCVEWFNKVFQRQVNTRGDFAKE